MSTLRSGSSGTAVQQSAAQTPSTAAGEADVRADGKLCPPSDAGNPLNETGQSVK